MDSLEKERERKEIQYDIFSGFLAGLSGTGELPVDFNEKLFRPLFLCRKQSKDRVEICKGLRYNYYVVVLNKL